MDAVLLADFAARQGGFSEVNFDAKLVVARRRGLADCKAVDLCTGTGIIPLILSYKTNCSRIYGVEVQQNSYERAVRSVQRNGLQARVQFFRSDVKDFCSGQGVCLRDSVDVVTCNPPYTQGQGGLTNANSAKTIARHETTAGLAGFRAVCSAASETEGKLLHGAQTRTPSRHLRGRQNIRAGAEGAVSGQSQRGRDPQYFAGAYGQRRWERTQTAQAAGCLRSRRQLYRKTAKMLRIITINGTNHKFQIKRTMTRETGNACEVCQHAAAKGMTHAGHSVTLKYSQGRR